MRMLVWPVLAVFVLTAVWVGIRAMTAARPDVDSAVRAMHEDGNTPWRAAILLEALRQPSGASMRADPALARRVAELLEHELGAEPGEHSGSNSDKSAATVRTYLCRALAQFEVDDGLPVLLRIVKDQTDATQADERRTAIEAVAALSVHIQPTRLAAENRGLIPALIDAADSSDPRVRGAAAYALGVFSAANAPSLGEDVKNARATLHKLLHDAFADVRYNAATGLARAGDAACEEVLLEMLDPTETGEDRRCSQEDTVLLGALAASELLVKNNPRFDAGRVEQAVVRLAEGKQEVPPEARRRAAELVERWKN